MGLHLYHLQSTIYWGAGFYLFLKFFANYVVHRKLDTYIHNIEKYEGLGHWGNNKNTHYSQGYEQGLLYFFTTWWDIQKKDDIYLKRAKIFSNFLNITSILLIIGLVFFFLYMQEVNHKYRYIKEDPWQYFL